MRYDPESAPSPQEWLDLDEQERIAMVEKYHRRRGIRLPNVKLHAIIHAIVENQLAMQEPGVVRVFARLQDEGLDRHEAIHAVGSVLAGQIHGVLTGQAGDTHLNEAYLTALEELTVEKWRAG